MLQRQFDAIGGYLDFRQDVFFEGYVSTFGPLEVAEFNGMSQLLSFIDQDDEITDVCWAAYMLATAKLENANSHNHWRPAWYPVEEGGKGHGKKYGHPAPFLGSDGVTYHHVYYGRGYVQLTHLVNYVIIMSIGMREGAFCGHGATRVSAARSSGVT